MGNHNQSAGNVAFDLEAILQDLDRREVLLYGYGTGNPIQIGAFHKYYFKESIEETFVHNWIDYLKKRAELEGMTIYEAEVLTQTAYNVVVATEFILMERDSSIRGPLKHVPQIKPSSRFRKDLGFNDDDYAILHGTLKYPPKLEGFEELKLVTDCIDFVIDRYIKKSKTMQNA